MMRFTEADVEAIREGVHPLSGVFLFDANIHRSHHSSLGSGPPGEIDSRCHAMLTDKDLSLKKEKAGKVDDTVHEFKLGGVPWSGSGILRFALSMLLNSTPT